MANKRVLLTNGKSANVPSVLAEAFRGLDTYGHLVIHNEYVGLMPLTPCCNATGTGSGEGVACRSCYQYVDDYFGGTATVAVPRAEEN